MSERKERALRNDQDTRAQALAKLLLRPARGSLLQAILLPVLAVFTALIIGALVIVFTDLQVLNLYKDFFSAPGKALAASWKSIASAYSALFKGSIGNPAEFANAISVLRETGDTAPLRQAFWPISESLVTSVPYIFAGLAVALGFQCGLFNIGAEGQIFIGALASVYVGYSVKGLPQYIHLPLAFFAGAAAAGLWAAVAGVLKAKTGAHEVINTIMMNYIAFLLSDWLLNGPMRRPGWAPISPAIRDSAWLPKFFPDPLRFHAGFFVALGIAAVVYWLLFKTTIGFEIRSVGANPDAARYAGISVTRNFVLAMFLSGALAGMAGANEVLGVNHQLASAFSSGYGFDSIALALLGKSHPAGVVLAALLFGTLRSGATRMQSLAGVPVDIISILQALVIIFIAAPAIIRWIYRIRLEREVGETVFTRGWGQ
ncbi:MAG: ABC transporter permease [Chloroflexi bacterium]|nr:ABC transporter permease [Chloroflexota bacterium]